MYSIMIIDDSEYGFEYTVIDNFYKKIIKAGNHFSGSDILDLLDHIKELIKENEEELKNEYK